MKQTGKKRTLKAILLTAVTGMMLFSGVQTTRAALSIRSDVYTAQTNMQSIGISLVENGNVIPDGGQLLQNLQIKEPAEGVENDGFNYGVVYTENLSVRNTGDIEEYAKVILRRYWLDENGKKDQTLDPELIRFHLTGNWIQGGESASKERLVLYYNGILPVGGEEPFIDALQVDGSLAVRVSEEVIDGKVYIVYDYDGAKFVLEAEAQAVQTHNAAEAVTSSWGAQAARLRGLGSGTVATEPDVNTEETRIAENG